MANKPLTTKEQSKGCKGSYNGRWCKVRDKLVEMAYKEGINKQCQQ